MTYQSIRVERTERVTIITIDRQEVRNALDLSAQGELAHAFDEFVTDEEQWVAILTGAGSAAFCAGHDLRTRPARRPDDLPASGFGGLTARFDLDKPVIAAVNGVAAGGGFEMALACDIIVAARRASFALPEVKVGMTALGGGILRLTREIGLKRAMGMMLTGRRVSASEAFTLGFITEVVQDEELMPAAMRWAEAIVAASPLAVRATKQVALQCLGEPLEQASHAQWHLPAVTRVLDSADALEGPAAFRERRPPQWRGR